MIFSGNEAKSISHIRSDSGFCHTGHPTKLPGNRGAGGYGRGCMRGRKKCAEGDGAPAILCIAALKKFNYLKPRL